MALYPAWIQLCTELDALESELRVVTSSKGGITAASQFSLQDECLLEGILSRIWQSWGAFCRTCVVESCMGTVNGSGAAVAALPGASTAEHVSAAAIRAKSSAAPPTWTSQNYLLRYEPTWGDANVLGTIIPRLGAANAGQMSAAFSSGHRSVTTLQVIRNAAAHTNNQTMSSVQGLRSMYLVFPVTHPTHALFWVEPVSRNYLVFEAIDSLQDTGFTAIS